MKKYFLLVLIHFLLLGACGGGETERDTQGTAGDFFEDDAVPKDEDEKNVEKSKDNEAVSAPPAPELQSNLPLQSCLTNLVSLGWTCEKEETIYRYFVNQRPSTIDEKGTDRERVRICEFHEGTESLLVENSPVVAYAHYQKDYCVNQLNREITTRRKEGFECKNVKEVFDATKEQVPCS